MPPVDFVGMAAFHALIAISDSRPNDFFRGSHSSNHLSRAIFPQRAHSRFSGADSQGRCRHFVVNKLSRFVIDKENLEDAETTAVTGFGAFAATLALRELGVADVIRIDAQSPQLRFGRHGRLRAFLANLAHQPLSHQSAT